MSRVTYVPYPPTSFPFRDLLVLEQLPLSPSSRVCEVGVGSGATTARLAQLCREVVGVEISAPAVEALRYLEHRHDNLRFRVADVTEPRTLVGLEKQFDRLVSCDTLEHVADADAYFRGLARLLAPGGRFLVTFPNEPKHRMHGITRFDSPAELAACVKRAGFVDVHISTVRLAPSAERVAQALGWKPLEVVRSFTRRKPKKATAAAQALSHGDAATGAPPQTFEQTSFFKRQALYKRVAPVVNLYWFGVLRAMESGGPSFEVDEGFRGEPFEDGQVMILGSMPADS